MNNFEGILTALASVVGILTGVITAVAKINGAHPLAWLRSHTIDRFRTWVEAPRRDIEKLQYGLVALQQQQRMTVDEVHAQVGDILAGYSRELQTIHFTATKLNHIEEQLSAQRNESADLKAALRHQARRVNHAMSRSDQAAKKLSEVESSLATLRQWVEQVLPTSTADGDKTYMSMEAVILRIETLENEIGTLRDTLNMHIEAISKYWRE